MSLTTYINDYFAQVKSQLGWSDSTQIAAIITKTLELYGVDNEGDATNTTKLHALADVSVWRQALNDISLDYGFSADGASYSRNQAVNQIRDNLRDAESTAMVYMPNYQMIVHQNDPNPDWSE